MPALPIGQPFHFHHNWYLVLVWKGNILLGGCKSLGSNQAAFVWTSQWWSWGFKPQAILIRNGLKRWQNPLWEVSGVKPVRICCGLLNNGLRGSNTWPFSCRIDLNGNKTLYEKSLGSNQAAFVVDFLTIVSGVQAPSHSYTEWT